ncbi:phosphate signaling complex protein PhoU [Streptomyces gilvus]|uniref:phosphate signaling complex protein PhoU n=1 Tax=Streptomyces gilvus TaxID=2920937 RepID=UPI001F10A555|nr:phosphate signaling complex protein PhoU [Streptomyces sp. CME 23]MCH5671032.1 phosphate signaling complex protein PhoU [Streptomyces sp. CME 23]
MRESYHKELESINEALVELANLVGSAMGRATGALLDTDLQLAEQVISTEERIEELQRDLEERAIAVLARQQPVATDLRMVVTSLRMSADLERCGVLARHVTAVARRRHPAHAVPQDLRPTILEMGQLAQRLMAQAADLLITQDVDAALRLEQDDDRMDELHRMIFHHLMDDRWHHGVETAVDVTLVGRYYERFADHAVSIARRVVYLVTGESADDYLPDTPLMP